MRVLLDLFLDLLGRAVALILTTAVLVCIVECSCYAITGRWL